MNNFGKQKDAAWTFIQWASSTEHDLFGARKMDFVNPVRASVWKDDEFRSGSPSPIPATSSSSTSRRRVPRSTSRRSRCSSNVTTDWAATLQRMVANEIPVDDGLDQLAASIDKQLKQAGLG